MPSDSLDRDGDGIISDRELEIAERKLEIELREQKQSTMRKMAWVALGTMVAFTIMLFTPYITTVRIDSLSELSALFYISLSGIVGAYMGVTSWMSKK
jgi:cytochrome bd-type quinol oxidase subunit 2